MNFLHINRFGAGLGEVSFVCSHTKLDTMQIIFCKMNHCLSENGFIVHKLSFFTT